MIEVLGASAASRSSWQFWREHFRRNALRKDSLPWHDSCRLTPREKDLVGRALQQFQLGEWGRGYGLLRRAASHPLSHRDPDFVPSLELFIAEEQRHSRILGCFLDREEIPRLPTHWIDRAFRRLRKLAGLEVCLTVLVTAEILAMPFYQALRDATGSPLLRAISIQILSEESDHLTFQARTIALLRRQRGAGSPKFLNCLVSGTALLVWQQHRRIFRAAGWTFCSFWSEAQRNAEHVRELIKTPNIPAIRWLD